MDFILALIFGLSFEFILYYHGIDLDSEDRIGGTGPAEDSDDFNEFGDSNEFDD